MRRLAATIALTATLLVATAPAAGAAPRACTRALDRAEAVMDLAVEGFALAASGFQAAAAQDASELNRINGEVNALAPRVRSARNAYDRAARACRAA